MNDESFLGTEFLLWLWWRAETDGGIHRLPDGGRVGAAVSRILEFREPHTNVRVTIRADAPTRAPEAREALGRSMRLVRAGFVLALGDDNVDVVLDASSFDLRQIVCERSPDAGSEDDAEERERGEASLLFGAAAAVEALFGLFLEERTHPAFARETLPSWRAWMRGRSRGHGEGESTMVQQT